MSRAENRHESEKHKLRVWNWRYECSCIPTTNDRYRVGSNAAKFTPKQIARIIGARAKTKDVHGSRCACKPKYRDDRAKHNREGA